MATNDSFRFPILYHMHTHSCPTMLPLTHTHQIISHHAQQQLMMCFLSFILMLLNVTDVYIIISPQGWRQGLRQWHMALGVQSSGIASTTVNVGQLIAQVFWGQRQFSLTYSWCWQLTKFESLILLFICKMYCICWNKRVHMRCVNIRT